MKVFTRLAEWGEAELFRAFEMLLSGGGVVPVEHPELLRMDREERHTSVTTTGHEYLLSALHVIDFRKSLDQEVLHE